MKKNIFIKSSISIKEAMKCLNITAEKCLLVVDEEKKLLGTLTDGDIRRSILSGKKVSDKIENSYCKNPYFLIKGNYIKEEVIFILRDKKIDLIPVVDEYRKILDYLTLNSLGREKESNKNLENVSVVIMAGGRGTRLEPFTKVLPKPLIPIHDKTIIENIIENFTKLYCKNFYLTVNYKARILKAYFEELNPEYNVNYIDEKKPLGTAGSLFYLKNKFKKPFFVTNCDILIKADYSIIYDFHNSGNFDITLVASTKDFTIPYGSCELTESGLLSRIIEKPSYELLINTGLYVLSPEILNLINENKFLHITNLIEKAKNKNMKVGVFPIEEDAWIDVGQWVEYKKVIERMEKK